MLCAGKIIALGPSAWEIDEWNWDDRNLKRITNLSGNTRLHRRSYFKWDIWYYCGKGELSDDRLIMRQSMIYTMNVTIIMKKFRSSKKNFNEMYKNEMLKNGNIRVHVCNLGTCWVKFSYENIYKGFRIGNYYKTFYECILKKCV